MRRRVKCELLTISIKFQTHGSVDAGAQMKMNTRDSGWIDG